MAPPPMVGHQKKLLSIRNKIYERLKATFFCSLNTCPNLLSHQKSRLWPATAKEENVKKRNGRTTKRIKEEQLYIEFDAEECHNIVELDIEIEDIDMTILYQCR
jgi:hypothetical protein